MCRQASIHTPVFTLFNRRASLMGVPVDDTPPAPAFGSATDWQWDTGYPSSRPDSHDVVGVGKGYTWCLLLFDKVTGCLTTNFTHADPQLSLLNGESYGSLPIPPKSQEFSFGGRMRPMDHIVLFIARAIAQVLADSSISNIHDEFNPAM
nr:hypothetical protein Iba_chr14aCG10870 [Ipomoea batatas]